MALTVARLKQLQKLQKILQINFQDLELLNCALTHCSYDDAAAQAGAQEQDNERLEFLGDAVLKLVVSEYLFQQFPARDEGSLTKIRAVLVSDSMLADIGAQYTLGQYLRLSRNEENNGGRARRSNLANGMEALFAAYYLDSGLDCARELILRLLQPVFAQEIELSGYQDYKSVLQEKLQALGWKLPEYRVIQEAGPEHEKVFTSQVTAGKSLKKYKQSGQGRTKKESEQRAARNLLELLAGESATESV
ncbi:MAG: ribonuclease III [Candidatus Margulisbacteria bacterium]|jgi:ribonuclease-3|nr:ribonuclease III [Candidatus Margulisiibacteriota bacterium]